MNEVKYGSRVYLTKNGHGQITMINMQEWDELEKELALYRFKLKMEKGEKSILREGTVSMEELKWELGIKYMAKNKIEFSALVREKMKLFGVSGRTQKFPKRSYLKQS